MTMTILDINNRTENWKTAVYFSRLFDGRSIELAERLGGELSLTPDDVRLELFWRGMRDLLYQSRVKKRSVQENFADAYVRLFPDLRRDIQEFGKFRQLQNGNYDASTGEQKVNLVNNLANTEIDIVLETPRYLFIGEAKHEMSFGGNGKLILVHQLVRQYVMAKILVEYLSNDIKKEVIPFVVGDNVNVIKRTSQVRFMVSQGWLNERNILEWEEIKSGEARRVPHTGVHS